MVDSRMRADMRANPYRDSLQLSRSSTNSGGRSSPPAVAHVDAEQKVDVASLSFAKRPLSLASARLSGDRASMGDDGDEAVQKLLAAWTGPRIYRHGHRSSSMYQSSF